MILFFISIILIVVSLVTMLIINIAIAHYIAAVLCLTGVYLMYLYWQKLFERSREKVKKNNDSLHRQIANLQKELNTFSKEKADLEARLAKLNRVPTMPEKTPLIERVGILKAYFSDDITENQTNEYVRLFSELEDATITKAMIKSIGEHTTKPLLDEIKTSTLPLDENTSTILNSKLLRLALIAIDFTSGFKSSLDENGSLATKVASGEITEAQAIRQAKKANENVYETPKEIRVLKELTKEYNTECIIVNDYKF